MTRWIDNKGYVRVTDSTSRHGWTYEHRQIVERIVGRPLDRTEHVHHKNGKKDDNRITNLEVLSASKHIASHNSSAPKRKKGVRSAYDEWVAAGRVGSPPNAVSTRPSRRRRVARDAASTSLAPKMDKATHSRLERIRAYWQAKYPLTATIPATSPERTGHAEGDVATASAVQPTVTQQVARRCERPESNGHALRRQILSLAPVESTPLASPDALSPAATDRSSTQPTEAPTATKSTTSPNFQVAVSPLALCARREEL